MSDHLNHNLDDELLSAYLDDELTPELRAAVEERLAADPAARQLLDELRSVAQSVRDLPTAALGRDLREAIVQRAKTSKAASNAAPTGLDGSIPKITMFRTARGWLWASLAVAAALLIMFFQSDQAADNDLPAVAQRHREPPVMTAAPEPPATVRSRATDLADGGAPMAPPREIGLSSSAADEPDRLAMAMPESDESDESDDHHPPSSSPRRVAGSDIQHPAAGFDDEPFVVVHVLAKREALENRSFDRLLASQGIVVEPAAPADATSGVTTRRAPPQADFLRRAESTVEEPAGEVEEVDVVLVEAPQRAIVSFLVELNRDADNYLGLAVDDSATDEASTLDAAPAKKLSFDLGKYSRGVVPQQQKDTFARGKAFYYEQAIEGEHSGAGVAGGRLDAPSGVAQDAAARPLREIHANQGRAQRVQLQAGEERVAGTEKLRELQRQLKSPAPVDGDTLQVMFVLSANGDAASSPPAENRTK